MEQILLWIKQRSPAEWGVMYLVVVKVLTVVQDAVDAQPPNLKPPFGKIIYYLTSIGGYLFAGNRPTAITPTQKTGG